MTNIAEESLIKKFLWMSLAGHLFIFFLNPRAWFPFLFTVHEIEGVLDVELANDDWAKHDKEAIKNSKMGEEIKVKNQILPQLPKNFTLEEAGQKPKEILDSEAPEKTQSPPQDEDKPETQAKEESQDLKREALLTLKKQEAIERLLKEKAREKQKFAEVQESPDNDLLVQRKKQLAEGISSRALSVGDNESLKSYQSLLKSWVQKHYLIPEAYTQVEGQGLAVIEIVLGDKGDIRKLDLVSSSKNPAFDALAIKTMESAVPFPAPPKELVGVRIRYRFDH